MKKFLLIIIIFTSFLSLFFSCDESTGPPNNNAKINLTLEDVSCTEVWLKIQVDNPALKNDIILYRDNKEVKRINILGNDTIIYDESLLPNKEYTYIARLVPTQSGEVLSEKEEFESGELIAKTMDTTSHNFTWQTFTFGQHSSSILYDVAIIDENNIWAVGEIYMNDSLGNPDPNAYNAIRWDGSQWKLYKLQFYTFCGQSYTGSYPAKVIFAFDNNNIIISSGSQLTYLNGNVQIKTECVPVSVNKLWGSSSNDLYAVGNNGNIAHYQNGQWSKIESGTTSIINDAWGITNQRNNTIVYCAVSSFFVPGDKKILKLIDGKVDSVSWGKDVRLYSTWTNNEKFLFVCGEGVYINKLGTWKQITLPAITTNSIRGNDINDVFAVGSLGAIFHFNGINWQVISSYTQKENYRVDFKNNIVAICGYYNGKGFIEIGIRN